MRTKSKTAIKTPHYGNELKKLMKESGMRQTAIAKRLGSAPASITNIIQNESPLLNSIRKICGACGVNMADFIYRVENEGREVGTPELATAQQIVELKGQCEALNGLASAILNKIEQIAIPEASK